MGNAIQARAASIAPCPLGKIETMLNAMSQDELKRQVESLSWYHTIDLGNGIVTPGFYDLRPCLKYFGFPQNLTGKTVLDIGAGSGFFSFELERRGGRVTATDLPEWAMHDFGPMYTPDQTPQQAYRYLHEPFELAKRALGSQILKQEINIYDISPQTTGIFDLVFCGNVLLHLTDPIKALWKIQSVTRHSAIIATVIDPNENNLPMALFQGGQRGDVWWIPNRAGFEAMVSSAGFEGWTWMSQFNLQYANGGQGPTQGVIRAWNVVDDLDWPQVNL